MYFDYEMEKRKFMSELDGGKFAIPTITNSEEDYYKNGDEDSKEKRDTRASAELPECALFDKIMKMK